MEDIIIQHRHKPVKRIVSYEKLMKKIRKRRITLGSFAKKAGISREDLYAMRIGTFMTLDGEIRACIFFECDIKDIRDIFIPDTWIEDMRAECIRKGADPDHPISAEANIYEEFV